MSHPLTKYVAAGALAGAVAFGGFTLAGAQDGGSTTTTPPATTAPANQGHSTRDRRTAGARRSQRTAVRPSPDPR